MFGVDWSNPETFWLNMMNLGLGLVVLGCLAVAGYAFAVEIREKLRKRAEVAGMDRELSDMVGAAFNPHVFVSPELGVTMADGGEPIEPAKKTASAKRPRTPAKGR